MRTKWRIKKIPPFTYERATSMAAAYRRVAALRTDYRVGLSNVHEVVVESDEGNGWGAFERIVFPDARVRRWTCFTPVENTWVSLRST